MDHRPSSTRCLVFDLGAGSGRAVLAELAGDRLDIGVLHRFSGYETRFPDGPGWAIETIRAGLREGLARAGATGRIDAVAVDSWGVDFAVLDGDGALVDTPRSYRHPRGAAGMAALSEHLDAIGERTGVQVLPIATVFHLRQWATDHPDLLERARHVVMIADLFAADLSGVIACERTLVRTSGLLSVTGTWDRDVIGWADLPDRLFGRLVDAGTVLGPIRRAVAEGPAFAETRVIAAAGHDTAAAAFALAPVDGEAFAVFGSWNLFGADVPDGRLPPGPDRRGFGLEGGIGGRALLTRSQPGLFLLRRLREAWEAESGEGIDFQTLGARALAADPGTPAIVPSDPSFFDPVDILATLRGSHAALGRASIGELARALYAGLAGEAAGTLRDLAAVTGTPIHTIRVGGGGRQDAALMTFLAEKTGCRLVAGPVEASVVGSALIQFVALGAIPSFEAARHLARRGVGGGTPAP